MKTPEYVATVTRIYRKYIDLALSGNDYIIDEADKKDAEEYIEICKQNGYTVSDSDDYYDESGEIYWTGYSVDGKKYVEVICETGTNYLTICFGEE